MASPPVGQTEIIPLNAAQRTAVEHLHGPLLVVAGAGTGKTRVIIERILYLLDTIPELQGENILAITYTNKAADEMKARLRRRGDKRAEDVGVYTFHAFCYELLRRHDEAVRILDAIDYWIFLRRRLDQLGLDIFKRLAEPGRFLNAFREFFSRCQDELVSPADYARYVEELAAAFEKEKNLLAEDERREREEELRRQWELARAYEAAERLLAEAKRTTFGGSLLAAVKLLESNAAVREHYQDRLRYILVDEFQDANIAQIRLLELLAAKHQNITAVGDDDQAIYRFRGASYASFRLFARLFPNRREITLAHNYRSTARLLRVATELIAQNEKARFDPKKKLIPTLPPGEKVRLVEVEDAAAEAAHIASELKRRYERTGSYEGSAVLYRAHLHRNALVQALTRARIPFVVRGLSVLTNTLVRDLLAYLRAIENPRDNIALARLLAIPAWQATPEMLFELIQRAQRERTSLAAAIESLHPAVRDQQTPLGALLGLLAELRRRAAELSLMELFDLLLERLELRLLPADPDRPSFDAFVAFLKRWEEEKSQTRRLAEFLEYLDYFEEADGRIELPEDRERRDAVQLMTVHSAKGLEFDSVFVLRLNHNEFPTRRRNPLFEFPLALMKEEHPPGDFHIQEERRLCYVALTRAGRRLDLVTLAGERQRASIFLEDILRDARVAREVEQARAAPAPVEPPAGAVPEWEALFAARQNGACYSRIVQWATQGPVPEAEEPLRLSHSDVETYLKCPLKYKLAHRWKLPGAATPAMLFGKIMHSSVAEFWRARREQRPVSREELQHIYEQQWRQSGWPFRDAYQEREYRSSGWEQLQGFYERHAGEPVAVLELEKTFHWPWQDVVLTGRMDQVNRLGERAVEIIEYKTGQPRPAKKVEKDLQLALYAAAAEQHLGWVPRRLTLYNFTVNEPISFLPTERNVTRALDTVLRVADGIRAGDFRARPGFHCRYCDYQRLCPEYEQPPAAAPAGDAAPPTEDVQKN
ncbi:MAG: ATP-dependent helicase [Acidobacteria bacterium]|nr:ATP-dependent helicase [Acidobacteriota bacterium]